MKFMCRICGFVYDENKIHFRTKLDKGTKFNDLKDFSCPSCGAEKEKFMQLNEDNPLHTVVEILKEHEKDLPKRSSKIQDSGE